MQQLFRLLIFLFQPYMFRAINSSILRSNFWLYIQTWCVFDRALLHMRRDEKLTRCHWMVYCTYNMLNMFRTLLCPSSGARDYVLLPPMVCSAWLLVVGGHVQAAGYVSRKRDVARISRSTSLFWTHSLLLCTWPPTTSNQALHTIGGNNAHIVSSSWWWA